MLKGGILVATIVVACSAAAQPCPQLPGATKLDTDRYVVFYRTRPEQIAVGQRFAMDVVMCPRLGGQARPESVRVDALMPEHRHGMNYRTTVRPGDGPAYVAEGFMFHMAGRWEFIFELRADGRTDRVTRALVLE